MKLAATEFVQTLLEFNQPFSHSGPHTYSANFDSARWNTMRPPRNVYERERGAICEVPGDHASTAPAMSLHHKRVEQVVIEHHGQA